MADLPILYQPSMVRAMLTNRKRQTRRLITSFRTCESPHVRSITVKGEALDSALKGALDFRRMDGNIWSWKADPLPWQQSAIFTTWVARVGYAPGDRLWVREAWRTESRAYDDLSPSEMDADYPVIYEADADWKLNRTVGRLRASMHMPLWASRITLVVSDVRIERLQDISEADAIAEGIEWVTRTSSGDFYRNFANPDCPMLPWGAYGSLWNHINGAGAWEANPWVTATTFTVHRCNINDMEAARG